MDIAPNILYDDRRLEYFPLIVDEMQRQGIVDYKWVSPIMSNNVVKSINLSQKSIVQKAKDNNEEMVCIFEQDIHFPHEKGWQYFLDNMPKEFDVYIGGSYLIDNRYEYKSPLVKVNEWVGNHCIIIHKKYYDTFLSLPDDRHIDTENKGKGDFYVCFPYAALQRAGFSSNNMCEVNYNSILTDEYIYK
jgi:hypothetical protein